MIAAEAQDLFALSDNFHQLANAIGKYVQYNKNIIGEVERNDLYNKQIELLQVAGEINIVGVSLVFEDAKDAVKQLTTITEEVKKTVKKVLLVQDAIDLATSLVGIGTAVLSQDPKLLIRQFYKAGNIISAIKNKTI